jgi:hypothetical protein
MTYQELIKEEHKLSSKMSLGNMSKKDEADINSLLNKISRFKVTAQKGSTYQSNNQEQKEVASIKASIDRLIRAQASYREKISEIDSKTETIKEDI